MAQVESPPIELTLADLTRQFGAVPAWRIRTFPTPGTATEPAPSLVPDLAIEVLSTGNTPEEMSRKLQDYFDVGARLVWYFDPRRKTVQVCTDPERSQLLSVRDTLTGGDVLPGFTLSLQAFFEEPQADASIKTVQENGKRSSPEDGLPSPSPYRVTGQEAHPPGVRPFRLDVQSCVESFGIAEITIGLFQKGSS